MSYLFLHIDDDLLHEDLKKSLQNYSTINLFQSKNKNITISHPQVYVYCFTEEQVLFCIDKGYHYHLCFYSNDILTSTLFKYYNKDTEVFWFPFIEDFTKEKQVEYAKFFNDLNLPICISISAIFNPLSVCEESRVWIKELYSLFSNPLIERELEIINNELFNTNNHYIHQTHNNITIQSIILGYMGDHILSEHSTMSDNAKTIFRTSECANCDYQEQCINRGIGLIIKENKYKGCCGIKIFHK